MKRRKASNFQSRKKIGCNVHFWHKFWIFEDRCDLPRQPKPVLFRFGVKIRIQYLRRARFTAPATAHHLPSANCLTGTLTTQTIGTEGTGMRGTHGHKQRLMLPVKNGKPKGREVTCVAVWAESSRMPKIPGYRGRDSQRCRGVSTVARDDSSDYRCRTLGVSEMQQQW